MKKNLKKIIIYILGLTILIYLWVILWLYIDDLICNIYNCEYKYWAENYWSINQSKVIILTTIFLWISFSTLYWYKIKNSKN